MNYWLIKSEAETYSIDDLKRDKVTPWEGVRNFVARNHMKDMRVGDLVIFYHSSSKPTGAAGVCKVVAEAHADESQFKKGDYFERRATPEKPYWYCVDIGFVEKFPEVIAVERLKNEASLKDMVLFSAPRLSVQPVSKNQFEHICKMH
jgi:predicted RNA-binding protein with PUA-like domain